MGPALSCPGSGGSLGPWVSQTPQLEAHTAELLEGWLSGSWAQVSPSVSRTQRDLTPGDREISQMSRRLSRHTPSFLFSQGFLYMAGSGLRGGGDWADGGL